MSKAAGDAAKLSKAAGKAATDAEELASAVKRNDRAAEVAKTAEALLDVLALEDGARELEQDLHDDHSTYTDEQKKAQKKKEGSLKETDSFVCLETGD